jgi:hypothetical protein
VAGVLNSAPPTISKSSSTWLCISPTATVYPSSFECCLSGGDYDGADSHFMCNQPALTRLGPKVDGVATGKTRLRWNAEVPPLLVPSPDDPFNGPNLPTRTCSRRPECAAGKIDLRPWTDGLAGHGRPRGISRFPASPSYFSSSGYPWCASCAQCSTATTKPTTSTSTARARASRVGPSVAVRTVYPQRARPLAHRCICICFALREHIQQLDVGATHRRRPYDAHRLVQSKEPSSSRCSSSSPARLPLQARPERQRHLRLQHLLRGRERCAHLDLARSYTAVGFTDKPWGCSSRIESCTRRAIRALGTPELLGIFRSSTSVLSQVAATGGRQ